MKPHNGHRSWNAWNVSLWINNDEGLYRLATQAVNDAGGDLDRAARYIRDQLEGTRTPDGAKYNYTAIRAAIEGYECEAQYQRRFKGV